MTLPVVANGIPVNMTKPSSPPITRVVVVVPVGILINGFPPALAGFTMSGIAAAAVPLSITAWNVLPCALVGAVVTCTDGYVGVFGPEHGPGGPVNVT